MADAVQTAFFEGKGICFIENLEDNSKTEFSSNFELDGLSFLEPNLHLFSFNNPYGACPICEGYGNVIGIDEDLVVPNTGLSIFENAIFPWRGDSMSYYKEELIKSAYKFDFPIHKPFFELTDEQKETKFQSDRKTRILETAEQAQQMAQGVMPEDIPTIPDPRKIDRTDTEITPEEETVPTI